MKQLFFVVMGIKLNVPHHLWRLADKECLVLSSHAISPTFCGLLPPSPVVGSSSRSTWTVIHFLI